MAKRTAMHMRLMILAAGAAVSLATGAALSFQAIRPATSSAIPIAQVQNNLLIAEPKSATRVDRTPDISTADYSDVEPAPARPSEDQPAGIIISISTVADEWPTAQPFTEVSSSQPSAATKPVTSKKTSKTSVQHEAREVPNETITGEKVVRPSKQLP